MSAHSSVNLGLPRHFFIVAERPAKAARTPRTRFSAYLTRNTVLEQRVRARRALAEQILVVETDVY